MTYRVLCAYDHSAGAERAFDFALRLARLFEGELHVLAVFEPAEASRGVRAEAVQHHANSQFEEAFEELRTKAAVAGVDVASVVSVGTPAQQILRRAEELHVDHLVVGQRGKNAHERTTLGSVSQRLVSHGDMTVTIVR